MKIKSLANYTELCQSLVGKVCETVNGDTANVLRHWVNKRGKDMFYIKCGNDRCIDVEAWHIIDALHNQSEALLTGASDSKASPSLASHSCTEGNTDPPDPNYPVQHRQHPSGEGEIKKAMLQLKGLYKGEGEKMAEGWVWVKATHRPIPVPGERQKVHIKYKGKPDLLVYWNGNWYWYDGDNQFPEDNIVHQSSWSAIEWLDESTPLRLEAGKALESEWDWDGLLQEFLNFTLEGYKSNHDIFNWFKSKIQ